MSHIATEPFLLSIFITMSDDKTKSQQRIWDCNKFHFLPNLSVSNSCWLTMLVGILCDVSPICQSLRSAHSMDSTGNGGSRSKVLRYLHVVRHQVPHLSKKVHDCKSKSNLKSNCKSKSIRSCRNRLRRSYSNINFISSRSRSSSS